MSKAKRTSAPEPHEADSHDLIRVHGARENNLKDVSVEIPKRRLTVFTGVSGSGKSSLVFSTIAAESQRMINETYSAFVQGFMPTLARPEVDVLDGLTTAIIVDQQRMGSDPRSTVGTATDANAMLRILFSRLGKPHIGSPQAFSFNVASISGAGAVTIERGGQTVKERRSFSVTGGMCPRCEGRGKVNDIDLTQLYDDSKSLAEGAFTIPGWKSDSHWTVRIYAESGFVDPDKPIRKYTKREMQDFLYKEATKIKIDGGNFTYEGLIPKIQKSFLSKDKEAMQPHIRAFVERAVTFTVCPECEGTRLSEGARSSKIKKINIAQACAMQISDLADWVRGLSEPSVAPLLGALRHTLDSFVEIGLGYLSLDRPSGTLSGGEAQRVKMIRHLGSSLTDVTYVFDEPTIGLHPHDIARMNTLLLRLRNKGNTVLVVEHKPETIVIADHVVDLGPGAGTAGGTVCFEGTVDGLRASGTVTGRHFDDRAALKSSVRTPTGKLEIRGATKHNLRKVDVDIPLGVLVVITGVAGSGKSSLVHGSMPTEEGVVSVDQSPIRGSRRSNPATYTGLLEPIRKAFAKANGVKPALFSANSEGACPNCNGAGVVYTDLGIMASMATTCEECEGKRFQAAVLDYHLGGKNISEVLAMSVTQATEFFSTGEAATPAAHAILDRLADVGLGYLSLGQPLTSLSGGERQRLKLATHMGDKGGVGSPAAPTPTHSIGSGTRASSRSSRLNRVFILDEPTTGLHLADVEHLLGLLDRLVEAGKSVIVVEHHQAVMAHADWIIDLGPGAGHDGGQIVFEGTPADLVAARTTLTGEHLAAYVGG
ncbi:ATP-binding cassette domain-containing protein [Crossiella cryophila]|uniref:UvrABC system protein A n=1 Tax=Crossiella cryophila TaxID=43355 RepID=A0A7W7G0I9_9PSEU|nr:excinuclease ABC subunit UvrA [Crossiella cryophila]MBB4682329.1 excinuclease UvrABC ATPase subunit [Crossiella cryophila]